jgi:hypothetical protein
MREYDYQKAIHADLSFDGREAAAAGMRPAPPTEGALPVARALRTAAQAHPRPRRRPAAVGCGARLACTSRPLAGHCTRATQYSPCAISAQAPVLNLPQTRGSQPVSIRKGDTCTCTYNLHTLTHIGAHARTRARARTHTHTHTCACSPAAPSPPPAPPPPGAAAGRSRAAGGDAAACTRRGAERGT